ncbi:MAG: hypothetical protein RIS50_1611, partial [Bacteroidota bacterium]
RAGAQVDLVQHNRHEENNGVKPEKGEEQIGALVTAIIQSANEY